MSDAAVPNFASSTQGAPSSVWDRISAWASENKAVVYTIAGVAVVVTGAGVAYYLTDSVWELDSVSEEKSYRAVANLQILTDVDAPKRIT